MPSRIPDVLARDEQALLNEWTAVQLQLLRRDAGLRENELREQCAAFIKFLRDAVSGGELVDINTPGFGRLRDMLGDLSRSRGRQGFTPSETATFVFSFKRPLFSRLAAAWGNDAKGLAEDLWIATELFDRLGLYTTEIHQKAREEIIARQQADMLELSTPVVKLWDGVVALPIIGTLDSARTQIVMENLLQKIVETSSHTAIIDITGVPTVDTLVAQHLLKTVAAARLMGADCIISGIRPQIAQTIVHLGVDLGNVVTKSSLADAFLVAIQRSGIALTRATAKKA